MYRIDFNKLRFLICDDNPHMRRILRTLLHSFGAREAYEAKDGATALEMYTHYVPDIVITDWSMPIFDGIELAQMIRQPESRPGYDSQCRPTHNPLRYRQNCDQGKAEAMEMIAEIGCGD